MATAPDGAQERFDDIVALNGARLSLLDLGSDDLHTRMTGFGVDGIAQVRREVEQIGLELRYRMLSLPRLADELLERLRLEQIRIHSASN